jgi:hypothetical protein
VPLGFPVRLRNRDTVRQGMFKHDIYPPVHWPIKGKVPVEFRASHRLARQVMTIPCDQRYSVEEMKRVAGVLRRLKPERI